MIIFDNNVIKISEVKPEDIARITVLKGESAIKTYGEKGKNGIVVITSKQEMQRLTIDGEEAFVVVEQMPQFPGGNDEMMKFIKDNLKYPVIAKERGVSGVVIVNFIIGRDGKINRIKVMRGIGSRCDEEAVRVLQLMPNWIPGKQGGKAVNVRYTVPVKFSLSPEPVLYREVEEKPQFPGGVSEMGKFFHNNLRYPVIAQEADAMGTALVYFIVNKNGKIENAKVLTEVHPSIKDEALRIINKMPEFLPGKKRGQAVDVACTIPFKFLLSPNPQNSQAPPTLKGDFNEVVVTGLGITKASTSVLQNIDPQSGSEQPVQVVEQPQYPGGKNALLKYLDAKLQYPVYAQEEGAAGTVQVYFIVKSNGKIDNVRLLNNVHPYLQAEALSVIRNMPDWIPGRKGDQPIDVACTIPLKFISQTDYQRSQGKSLAIGGAFSEIPFGLYADESRASRYSNQQRGW